jgi:hypothetical protein
VLREVFEAEREEVTRGWTDLHNEELYGSDSLKNLITKINQAGLDGQGI